MEKNALIDVDYNPQEKCIFLYLLKGLIKDREFKPYFYVDAPPEEIERFLEENHKELLDRIEKMETTEKIVINRDLKSRDRIIRKNVTRVVVRYPKDVPKLRVLRELGEIYEHDIPFTKRYLIDNDLVPMVYYRNIEDRERREIVSKEIPELKAVAFDMEVYCRGREPVVDKDPILMVSFYSQGMKKVLSYKPFEHECLELVKDERELIKRTVEILKDYNLIYTYNGDNFDFPYLVKRAKYLGVKIPMEIRISRGGMYLRSYIPGRIHLDLYPIVRGMLNLSKYTLEEVCYELFGVRKLEVGHGNIGRLWEEGDSNLVEYSLQDAYYTYLVGEYFLPLEVMFSRIVNQTLFEVSRMSSSQMVEYLLLKHSYRKNYLAPNRPSEEEYKRRVREYYEGGYVKEPIKGVHENIVSMDFRSLYPSIIITYNISPDTIDCGCCEGKSEKILGHWFCKRRRGLIPEVLHKLLKRRREIKEELKNTDPSSPHYKLLDYEQKSLKVLANSHYGYLAYPRARWYCKECAEVVTYLGRMYIQRTIEEAEKYRFKVIYADTDGLYATMEGVKSKEELLKRTYEFLREMNKKLPGDMELEFEGYYKRGIFVTKKKYALIDENNRIVIKGLELVRRDWSNIAKRTQREVLKALLEKGDIKMAKDIVINTIEDLRKGKVKKEDLVIYTQLTKDISRYKTTAPHVEVAKKILRKGGRLMTGDVIGYIITSGNGPVSERAELPEDAQDYDINYYIDNQVLPPVIRIMESLGVSKEELKSESRQSTLKDFLDL